MWENQVTAGYFIFSGNPQPKFDEKLAKKVVDNYIDYLCGKAIKTNLSGDLVEPHLYDRDAGKGKFLEIVNSMRN